MTDIYVVRIWTIGNSARPVGHQYIYNVSLFKAKSMATALLIETGQRINGTLDALLDVMKDGIYAPRTIMIRRLTKSRKTMYNWEKV